MSHWGSRISNKCFLLRMKHIFTGSFDYSLWSLNLSLKKMMFLGDFVFLYLIHGVGILFSQHLFHGIHVNGIPQFVWVLTIFLFVENMTGLLCIFHLQRLNWHPATLQPAIKVSFVKILEGKKAGRRNNLVWTKLSYFSVHNIPK